MLFLVVRVDQGSVALLIALFGVASPSIAVYLSSRLSRRAQRQIQEAIDAQTLEASKVADAARVAVAEAQTAAAAAKVTADETHHMVNSQKDQLERELEIRDNRIEILEARLRGQLPDEGGT